MALTVRVSTHTPVPSSTTLRTQHGSCISSCLPQRLPCPNPNFGAPSCLRMLQLQLHGKLACTLQIGCSWLTFDKRYWC